jgi:hypothetical protein
MSQDSSPIDLAKALTPQRVMQQHDPRNKQHERRETMLRTPHTPGPWLKAATADGFRIQANGKVVCWEHKNGFDRFPKAEAEANARLIAAAPELLDAMEEAEYALSNAAEQYATDKGRRSVILDGRVVIVRAAIAMATRDNP